MRPLTRSSVTAASRIMLPTYPIFAGLIGINFVTLGAPIIKDSPALRYATTIADLEVWGYGFLIVASILGISLCLHRRQGYEVALSVMIVWMTIWACVMVAAAFYGNASPTAWAWPAFVARAGWASLVSVKTGETQ